MFAGRTTSDRETERVRTFRTSRRRNTTGRSASWSGSCSARDGPGRARKLAAGCSSWRAARPATCRSTQRTWSSPGRVEPGDARDRSQRAQTLGHPADLRLGDVQALAFADESFETVTCTLGFCTIPDTRAAAAEAFRVLQPGGELLLLEHVRSPTAGGEGRPEAAGSLGGALRGRSSAARPSRRSAQRRL